MSGKEETDLLLADYFPTFKSHNIKAVHSCWIKTKIELIVPLKAVCIIITLLKM